jgi:hypothetical protein
VSTAGGCEYGSVVLRISVERGRPLSGRVRVFLGAIGIVFGLLMIAPSVSASEERGTQGDGIVRTMVGAAVHGWQCASRAC